jgi:hypothetical protein
MSDGPYKSLPMRRGWKKVAQWAANSAFAPEEICNALIPALARDWNTDVPIELTRAVEDIFGDQQDLFRDQKVMRLESLRPVTVGRGLGKVFLDCAIQVAASGAAGPEAPIEAATNALAVRASRGAQHVEEHYCRKSTTPRANKVRARIEEGIGSASLNDLARQLLKRDPALPSRTPPKQRGLDDGVHL